MYASMYCPTGRYAGRRFERSGLEPWMSHCVVFSGKKLFFSPSVSLHPRLLMVAENWYAGKFDEFLVADGDGMHST